ncbi:MAG: anaerobic ribonucleoside-triphosphate reductase activating protein [Erysipelotrichales bacterium]|nr:anaerobic ribonucleoside-triphosphate reductase activating protein [Erysipelotrichales bacterium]
MKLRVFGTVNDSIVDGPGLRYSVFTQGCPHHCQGCHNPKSHDIQGGYDQDTNDILKEIDKNPLLDGVTLSGGEPFMQCIPLIDFVRKLKERKLHIIIYSGFTYEEILTLGDGAKELLSLCDILVDGRFELSLRSLALLYRGSSNQRIIDVQTSLKKNEVVIQCINEYGEWI